MSPTPGRTVKPVDVPQEPEARDVDEMEGPAYPSHIRVVVPATEQSHVRRTPIME